MGIVCRRCGSCCRVLKKGVWIHCKYLDLENLCKIYKRRIYKNIGHGFYCTLRSKAPWDFPMCPYNTGKEIHPAYR